MKLRALILLVLGLFLLPSAQAQVPATPQNVRASVEVETATPAPGDSVTVAIVMEPKKGWHDYWLNPGDAGTPLELEWQLPQGVITGPVRAPVPETLIVSGFMNHIYKDRHAFLVDLKIPADARIGQRLDFKVDARWSACSDTVCIPEGGLLSVPLTVGDGNIDRAARARFDQWRAALPVPLDRAGRYAINGKAISIAIPYPRSAGVEKVWFFPKTENLFRYAAPQSARRSGDWLILTGEVEEDFDGPIEGLLRFGDAQGLELRALPGAVPTGGDPVATLSESDAPEPATSLGWILGFAVLGGLLLNLMPCVFPILGLKALSLAKMGGDESEARRDALAYAAGVILSCLALGGVMLALRAAGEEVGWAFQLQDPAIVLLLLLLMVTVTANLAGLFEVGGIGVGDGLTRKGGIAGSFWTGVLAAAVATPCTGPFMAAAMGGALLLPTPLALLVFAGLGLGLALPFLAVAFIPALRSRMPRPGPWMAKFRKWMAVPMALTALALLWLLGQLSGSNGLIIGAAAALAVLMLCWLAGRDLKSGKGIWPATLLILGVAIYNIGVLGISWLPDPKSGVASAPDILRSERFGESLLDEYRSEGRDIFVYFTADWCLTCKVNEAAALNREDTKRAFAGGAVNVLKGDYTRRDPDITRFLAKHGRSGVPLYLYYPKGGKPQVLPQILTVDMLTELAK